MVDQQRNSSRYAAILALNAMPRKAFIAIKQLPIRYILLIAFLFVGVLPTILMATLAYRETRTTLISEIQRDMQTRALATAGEIDRMMFERLQNVASWTQLDIMQDARIADVDKRLSQFLSEVKTSYRDIYTELYVLDKNGVVVASSNVAHIGHTPPALTAWLTSSLSQNTIHLAALKGERLPIYASIPDHVEAASLGTLVAVFNWQQIAYVLNNITAGRSAAALFDSHGQRIASTPQWPHIQGKQNIFANADTSGYQSFSGFKWQVTIAKHRSDAYLTIHRMTRSFITLLLATIALTIVIALPVSSAITRPLARLTRFANSFMRMPSNQPPPAGGPAEIDDMSRAFGKMIEDLERSKDNLTRAAKLAVVGEMAAAMSHEVRTPLGILRSSAQLLLREPTISEDGREVCGFIISETERLNHLVSTLIDSARPRAPEIVPTDMGELAQQTTAMLRAQAQKKNIRLQCQASPACIAACDREQITQVLLNLLLNAIQVLPDDGQVLVSVQQQADKVLIKVADDGPGVPAEQRIQIFDPFFTQRAGGIGLGLAVVRQIVLAHHGSISVHESILGQAAGGGAEFRLELPAAS